MEHSRGSYCSAVFLLSNRTALSEIEETVCTSKSGTAGQGGRPSSERAPCLDTQPSIRAESGTWSEEMNTGQRLPSLDGLRAISLSLVLCVHLQIFPKLERTGWIRFNAATLGMFVFFVISGFIITRLLADEREWTGTSHLPSFYGRRFFRIFPALLGYLSGLAVLGKLGLASCSFRQLLLGLLRSLETIDIAVV